jgi:hypothetical protein
VDGLAAHELSHADFAKLLGKSLHTDLTVRRAAAGASSGAALDVVAEEAVPSPTQSSLKPIAWDAANTDVVAEAASQKMSPPSPSAQKRFKTIIVPLRRDSHETKLGVKIGVMKSGDKVVTFVKPGSCSAGLLFERDIITQLDGVEVRELPRAEFVALMAKDLHADLTVRRASGEDQTETSLTDLKKHDSSFA